MGYAILINIFHDVKESTRMIKTNTTNYGEIKEYGCTILPCLSPDKIYDMYAAAYSESKETLSRYLLKHTKKNDRDRPFSQTFFIFSKLERT
ncbi:hypothetical protein [Exiguobacterium sp. s78]|uniref:hypothetical protein n=1 Tax=Exiguobacterium sp. s78 TaxID=2751197 RepID=UPI001BEA34CA|nr:hypothetical protein [Exiguobacterium sp. s78]